VNRIKADERCIDVLGRKKEIRAFGEPTSNKWARARPIASTVSKDKFGTEHLAMHFHVEGPENSGVVQLHMIRKPHESDFTYEYLYLDIAGMWNFSNQDVPEANYIKDNRGYILKDPIALSPTQRNRPRKYLASSGRNKKDSNPFYLFSLQRVVSEALVLP
jgi:hypothetical protein